MTTAAPTPRGTIPNFSYYPAKLRNVTATLPKTGKPIRVPVHLLPKVRVPNPAIIIGWYAAQYAYTYIRDHVYLSMAGLSYVSACLPIHMAGFYWKSNAVCSTAPTGGSGHPISQLPSMLATMGSTFVEVRQFSRPGRYVSHSIWRWDARTVARPYYGRPSMFQTHPAYAVYAPPGAVPFNRRPFPVWNAARPIAAPSPVPFSETGVTPNGGRLTFSVPAWQWVFNPPKELNPPIATPISPPISKPLPRMASLSRVAVNSMTREVKFGANTMHGKLWFALLRAREEVSEWKDFVEVIYKSLPSKLRKQYGGNSASLWDMSRAIWDNYHRIDLLIAMRNLLANQIEDEIIGQTWFKARGAIRDQVFDGQMGSLGPVGNPLFEGYAKGVSDISMKAATMLTQGSAVHHSDARSVDRVMKALENDFEGLTGKQIVEMFTKPIKAGAY